MSPPPIPVLSRRRFVAVGAASASSAVLTGAALGGCGRAGPGGLVVYAAGSPELAMASLDPESGTWQSAPWSAEGVRWLPYTPRAQLQVEHGLGRVPSLVMVYLSFSEDGATPALAAGDLARVIDLDASTVTVWNDTNGSYFARVVVG